MLFFVVAALVVILDQASKRIIWEIFQYRGGADIIDGFFRITLSKNKGAIFGIFYGWKNFLIVITIVSILVLIFFAYRMRYAPASKRVYLGLILGGAFGNLIDRLAAGEVLDFFDMGIGSYRWPTYNVADIAVTVGAFLLILGLIVHRDEGAKESEPAPKALP
jgi:signal peptidase II